MNDKKGSPFDKLAALRDALPPGPPAPEVTIRGGTARAEFAAKVVVRMQRKGHGGKTVTVVDGVLAAARDEVCSALKRALGCGARVEGDSVVVQGDMVERAASWLEARGAAKVVRGT